MKWRCYSLLFVLIVTYNRACAATFDPDIRFVCDPKTLTLSRELLNRELDHTKGSSFVDLISFLNRHRKLPDPQKGGVDTRGLAISGEKPSESLSARSITAFLNGQTKAPCYKGMQMTAMPGGPGASDQGAVAPPFLALRQTVDDLKYEQGSDGFKAAKAANLSASNDRISNKYSVGIDSALGYVLPRRSLDEQGNLIEQIVPFVTYNQQFVQAATPKSSSYAQNLGAGVTGDVTLFERHNVSFTPKYTESVRNSARLFSGAFAYTPMYGIPGVDNVYYIVPDMLSFLVTPQFRYVFRDVDNVGRDLTFLGPGDYSWYGARINFNLFGEGSLDGFGYNLTYDQYQVDRGKVKHVSNFQTSISYDVGANKNVSIVVKYQRGRNLDTLESINLFTVGLGLKL
jgi:hypothetical protein